MMFFGKGVAGAGCTVLNIFRVMNIISLLAVIAASAVMLVRIINNNTFFFFEACEHVIRVVVCGFLILTELPLFTKYWMRNWPLFSESSGFVMLGASMILVGNTVLANLNKPNASQEKLGMPFWRLVISSGVIIIVLGSVNILFSYVFRQTKINLTARQVRSGGVQASEKAKVESIRAASVSPKMPKAIRQSKVLSYFMKVDKSTSLPKYEESGAGGGNIDRSNTNMSQKRPQVHTYNGMIGSPYGMDSPGRHEPPSPSNYSNHSPRAPSLAHHPVYRNRF